MKTNINAKKQVIFLALLIPIFAYGEKHVYLDQFEYVDSLYGKWMTVELDAESEPEVFYNAFNKFMAPLPIKSKMDICKYLLAKFNGKYPSKEALWIIVLSHIYRDSNMPLSALELLDNIIENNDPENSKLTGRVAAKALREKGSLLFRYLKRKDHQALQLYLEAYDILIAEKNEKDALNTLNNIAEYLYYFECYDIALGYFQKIVEQVPPETFRVYSYWNSMGLCYSKMGEYDKAIENFTIGLNLATEKKDDAWIGLINGNLGETYISMGKYEEAIPLIEIDLNASINNHVIGNINLAFKALGTAYFKLNNYDKAERFLLQSLDAINKTNHHPPDSLYKLLFHVYEAKGDQDKSLYYLNKSVNAKDSILFNYTSNVNINTEVKRVFELYEKEKPQKKLVEENSKKNITLEKQSFIILSILVLVSILLVLSFFIYKTAINRKKANLLLQQNNKIIIAQNHEIETLNVKLSELLERKEKDLALSTLYVAKRNELISSVHERVQHVYAHANDDYKRDLNRIINDLDSIQKKDVWEEFEIQFKDVHPEFMSKLQEKFPNLSANERRLCVFFKLNMNTKEISNITSQSINSINVARTRLRKKLNINNEDVSLISFIQSLSIT